MVGSAWLGFAVPFHVGHLCFHCFIQSYLIGKGRVKEELQNIPLSKQLTPPKSDRVLVQKTAAGSSSNRNKSKCLTGLEQYYSAGMLHWLILTAWRPCFGSCLQLNTLKKHKMSSQSRLVPECGTQNRSSAQSSAPPPWFAVFSCCSHDVKIFLKCHLLL